MLLITEFVGGNIMKRTIGFLIGLFLIITSFSVVGFKYNETDLMKQQMQSSTIDELDQSQTVFNPSEDYPIPVGKFDLFNYTIMTAQSFKPTKNMLTRVELFVGRNDSTFHPYVLSIKKDLHGPNLVEKSLNPSAFTTSYYSWVVFDFEDIFVDIGQTYYIVCKTVNASGNWYLWAAHNDSLSYPDGCAWISTDGGDTWSNQSFSRNEKEYRTYHQNNGQATKYVAGFTWDTCFKTYGRDNQPPGALYINGLTNGKAGIEYDYTLITVDPDDDDVYYLIDWGDGSVDDWLGPFGSDTLITVSHIWFEKGTYIVRARAKDVHGLIGPWVTLEVSMAKARAMDAFSFSSIFVFGSRVDVKLVQLEPGEDYVDLEVLSKPFYLWDEDLETILPGAFIRLYEAKGWFSPSSSFCFGTCSDWGIIG